MPMFKPASKGTLNKWSAVVTLTLESFILVIFFGHADKVGSALVIRSLTLKLFTFFSPV